jgi:hypothetical protein
MRPPTSRPRGWATPAIIGALVLVVAGIVVASGLGAPHARPDAASASAGRTTPQPSTPSGVSASSTSEVAADASPSWSAGPADAADVRPLPLPPAIPPASPWPAGRAVPRAGVVSIDDFGLSGSAMAQETLASTRFALPVSFWLDAAGGDASNPVAVQSDFCAARVTEREVILPVRSSCVGDLRILLPSAVDCGTPDRHPDASALAAAILANPGLHARDLGPLDTSTALPAGFVRGAHDGRVIDVPGDARPFSDQASNPDGCRIEPGSPGALATPAIEIRGDLPARLILLDAGGELVIVRLSTGGIDGPSGAAARHGRIDGEQDAADLYWTLLTRMHDLSFGPAAIRP